MTDRTIDLDQHRGMAAQKATEVRRLIAEIETEERALRLRQKALEAQLAAAPSATWSDAAHKASYLLRLFAGTTEAQDPRRQNLIANLFDDFRRLSLTESMATPSNDELPLVQQTSAHNNFKLPQGGIPWMANVDQTQVEFQCPKCGQELHATIGRLKENKHMVCPGCSVGINIDTDRLANASEEIQRALEMAPPEITIKFFR